MGIQVWVARNAAADLPGRVTLGPGSGSVLLVCETAEQSSSRLAADIARALADAPVWAWCAESGHSLAEAVDGRLFTTLVLFGDDLRRRLCPGSQNEAVGSARVLQAPGLQRLHADAAARRKLWSLLRESRLAGGA